MLLILTVFLVLASVHGEEDIEEDPCRRELLPSQLRFTQDSIKATFAQGPYRNKGVGDVAKIIIDKRNDPDDRSYNGFLENIKVARGRDGNGNLVCFSASNRGLLLLKMVEHVINPDNTRRVQPYQFEVFQHNSDIHDQSQLVHDFTTKNDGFSIEIRGMERIGGQGIDLAANFWSYKNPCLARHFPSDIMYSTKSIRPAYNGNIRQLIGLQLENIVTNIVRYWNIRYARGTPRTTENLSQQRDIVNLKNCLLNMNVGLIYLGRVRSCFADDNQCLYILKEVERRVDFQRSDMFDFKVVNSISRGRINANDLLDGGRRVQIIDPQARVLQDVQPTVAFNAYNRNR